MGGAASKSLSVISCTSNPKKKKTKKRNKKDKKCSPSDSFVPTPENLGPDLWGKLFRPLPLLSCLKYERISPSFESSIYSGQYRFVWNAKFQEYLYVTEKRTFFDSEELSYLAEIAPKIGPYTRKLILKVNALPTHLGAITPHFTNLQSIYLKVERATFYWKYFICRDFPQTTPAELRVVSAPGSVAHEPTVSSFPPNFAQTLATNSTKLTSLQLWQQELQCPEQDEELFKLPRLTKYRLFLDDSVLDRFFPTFTRAHGHRLVSLYIKWQTLQITPQAVRTFRSALSACSALSLLHLQIHWNGLQFEKAAEARQFSENWHRLCVKHLPASLRKLSIDIQHTNCQTAKPSADLIASLLQGRKLKMLRIQASLIDVFPLNLIGGTFETLELSLHYLKGHRVFGQFCGYYDLLPDYNEGEGSFIFTKPKETSSKAFLRSPSKASLKASSKTAHSVKSLKLSLFPLLDVYIAAHIEACFPCLEMLSFSGFHQRSYNATGEPFYEWGTKLLENQISDPIVDHLCFETALMDLFSKLDNLRVLKLADKFNKPDLSELVKQVCELAAKHPGRMYALFIDWQKNDVKKNVEVLGETLNMKNLRVY